MNKILAAAPASLFTLALHASGQHELHKNSDSSDLNATSERLAVFHANIYVSAQTDFIRLAVTLKDAASI
jgi:hypothetical protein